MVPAAFEHVEAALSDLRAGKMVVLVDGYSREKEGDLVMAAQFADQHNINFMLRQACGLVCVALPGERLDALGLGQMSQHNETPFETAFTVSVEARNGVTTGISAADRAKTICTLVDASCGAGDLVQPGHVFPLRAKAMGVFARQGHTEGGLDLVKLAGLTPGAVICEIMNPDGSMMRHDDLQLYAKQHALRMLSIEDIIQYRSYHECLVESIAVANVPVEGLGEFELHVFRDQVDGSEHVAFVKPPVDAAMPQLVRIHSECFTGDVLGSTRCDCGSQLDLALRRIAKEGGVLVYLRQEGRGIGLANKIKAYALQDAEGFDTVEANHQLGLAADARDYRSSVHMLRALGLRRVRLLTNNPMKIAALERCGLEQVQRVPLEIPPGVENCQYLKTKKNKLGHLLSLV